MPSQHPSKPRQVGNIVALNHSRHRAPLESRIQTLVRNLMRELKTGTQSLTIVWVDDSEMKKLNARFRKKNATTDVLSFPSLKNRSAGQSLGDIVISWSLARRLATQEKVSGVRYASTLVIHGFLHLCGYDHEQDRGEMMALQAHYERTLLKSKPLNMA